MLQGLERPRKFGNLSDSDHMPGMSLRLRTREPFSERCLLPDLSKADCVLKSKHGDTRTSKSDDDLFDLRVLQLALKAV